MEQTDTTPSENTPANIPTAAKLDAVLKQVKQDQQDLPAALNAIQEAGTDEALANAAAVSSLLKISITSVAAETQTPDVILGGNNNADATATDAADSPTETGNGNNNNNGNGNGFGNGRFGNGNGFRFGNGKARRSASVFFA